MPRRYARSDVRASDTTSVDIQNHYPALKLRVSRSASLIRRVTPRGRGSGVFREHRFPSLESLSDQTIIWGRRILALVVCFQASFAERI